MKGLAGRGAVERELAALGCAGSVAHLNYLIGIDQRFLAPYALPVGRQYAPERHEAALRRLPATAHGARGRILRALNRRREALAAFNLALRADPRDSQALAWRGELLAYMDGEAERGYADLATAARLRPSDPWPRIWEAAARLKTSAGAETLDALDAALRADPGNTCALLLRAVALDRAGKPEQALADATRAARAAPSCAGVLILRGRLEAKAGRLAEAEASFSAATRLEPDAKDSFGALVDPGFSETEAGVRMLDVYVRARPRAGFAFALRGDIKRYLGRDAGRCIPDLAKAAELAPRAAWIRACLARAKVQHGCHREGLRDLRRAVALDPGCHWLHSWLAESYRSAKMPDAAIASFRRSIALNPRFAQTRLWLGRCLCDQGRLMEGLAEFTRAIELDCAYGFAYAKRGETLARLERHAEAIPDFDRALNLVKPCTSQWVWSLRCRSRFAAGDYAGALEDLVRTIRVDLRASPLALDLGRVDADPAATREAFDFIDEALRQNGMDAALHAWRGALNLGLGRVEQALVDLDRSLDIDSSWAWGRAWRGRALWHAGRLESAAAELDEALRRDGATPWLWSWRAELRLSQDRPKNALADAERALALLAEEPRALYCRGEALRRLGKRGEALGSLDRALRLDQALGPAYVSRGMLLGEQRDYAGQFRDFRRAARRTPDFFRQKIGELAVAAGGDVAAVLRSLLK